MGGVNAYPGGGTPGRVHLAPVQARARDRRILRPVSPLELEDIKACLSFVRCCQLPLGALWPVRLEINKQGQTS